MTRRGRYLRIALAVAVVAVLGVMVMPGRLWVGQRNDLDTAKVQLKQLRADHALLVSRVRKLGAKDYIEGEARQNIGWVHVGDESYTVTPEPPPHVDLPDVWPFSRLQKPLADAAASN